jgi:hypothetical protein
MIGYVDATDEMFGIIYGVLADNQWNAKFGYNIDVRWPGTPKAAKPDPSRLWARVSKQVVKETQTSLANVSGERNFTTIGLLFVQLFCPRNQPQSLDNGRLVAVAIEAAFRNQSPSGEIWFLNEAIRELAETDESYPITVVTEFQYDTLNPFNEVIQAGGSVFSQRTVTPIDATHYAIGGSPTSVMWFVDGLAQSQPDQFSYAGGIITMTYVPSAGAELIAIGE